MSGSGSTPQSSALHAQEKALAELMRRTQAGDQVAYRELLVEVRTLLIRYATRTLGRMGIHDPSAAEDLTQETLMALHQKRATYDPGLLFTPWLYAIARYKLIDFGRRSLRGSRVFVELPDAELGDACASGSVELIEGQLDVFGLLNGLPAKQRELLEQVKIQGASVAEVSLRTGMSESAVKVGVHRAIKALGSKLRKGEESDGSP